MVIGYQWVGPTRPTPRQTDSYNNTSEEATSARVIRSAVDRVSEMEVIGCTSSVRFSYTPRDDKGKAGCIDKLPSHKYKTPSDADWDDPSHCPLHPSTGPSVDAPASACSSAVVAVGNTPIKADPRRTPRRSTPPPPNRSHDRDPNASVSQPANRSRDVMRIPLEPDVVSSDSTNSPYDGSTDPTEHVATFRAQMALYDTSDALMCRTFPTTLRGPARMWYSRIKPSSISSFDQFAKEFELNFIASSCPRPTAASLLGLTQGNDEPLAQFVSRFSTEIRRMPDTHPTLAIQAFLMGLRPSRFFWSLIERPLSTVPEMLQRASQYVAVESLVAGKRGDHKKSRGDNPQGQPSGTPRRRDRPELSSHRPLSIPLNLTRTEVFLQIRDKGLLRTPNPIRAKIGGRDKRRYCRFH
ncbi:hypothetical protein BHE74_00004593 [Ensete ventricosum]|nr:hypothetical protein BHE74_00004593 [Ensete ventricosum]